MKFLCVLLLLQLGPRHNVAGFIPKSRKPNFLLIVLDDVWPYQWKQFHANTPYDGVNPFNEVDDAAGQNLYVNTPWIDALAARGMTFTSAYGNPVCGADRSSLLTGMYTHRHGIGRHPVFGEPIESLNDPNADPDFTHPLITTRLKAAGYLTGVVGKYQMSSYDPTSTISPPAPDTPLVDQFEHAETVGDFDDVRITYNNLAQLPLPPGQGDGDNYNYYRYVNGVVNTVQSPGTAYTDHLAADYSVTIQVDDTIDFITLGGDDPWFCYLAFNSPHAPWDPVADATLTTTTEFEGGDDSTLWANYQAQLESIDSELQRLQAAVDPVVWARTQIIFTADNGFAAQVLENADSPSFGNKDVGTINDQLLALENRTTGQIRYKNSGYEAGTRVPMIISGPGVLPGRVTDALFHVTDVYPTLVAAAGGTSGSMSGMDQTSVLNGTASSVRTTSMAMLYAPNGDQADYNQTWGDVGRREIGYIEEIAGARWKYVEQLWQSGLTKELYQLTNSSGLPVDPWELNDLYNSETPSAEQIQIEASVAAELAL